MKCLRNGNCLITGAASGIGRELALGLADEGMNLFIVDIDTDGLEAVKEEIASRGGQTVLAGRCDVSRYEDFQNVAREIEDRMGPVDLLVNNAGIAGAGLVEELDLKDWKRVLDVNTWSIIYSVRTFLPDMIARGSGHIVNVGSGAGIVGIPYHIPYIVSKFAVVGLSEALYSELKHIHRGIDISVICPSVLRTNIIERTSIAISDKLTVGVSREELESRADEFAHRFWDIYSAGNIPVTEAVRGYIKGIKKGRLYIFDTPRLRLALVLKGLSDRVYRGILRTEGRRDLEMIQKALKEMGIRPREF